MESVFFQEHNLSEYKCNGISDSVCPRLQMGMQVGSVELHAWYLFLEGIPAKFLQTGATSANYNLLLLSKTSLVTYCKEEFHINFPS